MNGEVLAGRYRLLTPLGNGGAGEVWRAEDAVLARQVAVKLLRRLDGDQMDALDRFRTEAQAAARLTHPNVVATYDVGTANGQVFLVMELVNGPDLAQLLRTKGLPPDRFVADIASQGARALDAAHAAGIVHRDVKPGNLLLAPDGTLKMTDFGIAQATGVDGATGPVLLGTAAYVSPEQVRGERATPASDWYALGCVLYELLEGTTPFVGPDVMDVMHQHLDAAPLPVRRTEGAPGLDALVMQLLSKDPAARPSSAVGVSSYLNSPAPQAPDSSSTRVLLLPPAAVSDIKPEAIVAGNAAAAASILPARAFRDDEHVVAPKRRFPFAKTLVGVGVVLAGVLIAGLLREGVKPEPTAQGPAPVVTPSASVKPVSKPKPTPTPTKTPSKKPTPKKTPSKKPSAPQNGTAASLRSLAKLVREHKQEHAERTVREAAKDLEQAAKASDEGDAGQAWRQYQQARQRLLIAQQQGRWQSTPQISAMFAGVGAKLQADLAAGDGDGNDEGDGEDGDTNGDNNGNGWNRN
ncbi:serine/threonine-protein kinase [Kribbella sp. NPDC056861]|uniref:serine/threonine-protein kinase n=1 Tax=Kribbella sp. NPDC056861 TaxID=3154857 RepID=UPI0034225F21